MRTIKFRVWCNTTKHFTDIPFYSCGGGQLLWHHTLDEITISNIDDGDYVIQQYTGLKDKNGKEIFESDVLEIYYEANQRSYLKKVKFLNDDINKGRWDALDNCVFTSCEVVGNIYENPELLKG